MGYKMKEKYYSLDKIKKLDADYNIIIGERSNGKTYACLENILHDYINLGYQGAYIRRWREDIIGKRAETLFNAFCENGMIRKLTHDKYDNVIYTKSAWHLAKYDNDKHKMIADKNPFCYAFSLSESEHDKSTSYPKIQNIVFDEFLTRRYYLPDEFIIFANVLSTIIRDRDSIKIYMLGNTVNKYCPYFAEMGLHNIAAQLQGTIDIYTLDNLKIAVEYCGNKTAKKSNKYFAFNNQRLRMVTSGQWELAIYPHLPIGHKIKKDSILFNFVISFNSQLIQGDIVLDNMGYYIYMHNRTNTNLDNVIVYTLDYTPSNFTRKCFLYPRDKIDNNIKNIFACKKVFYQSNDIGELVHNYLLSVIKAGNV